MRGSLPPGRSFDVFVRGNDPGGVELVVPHTLDLADAQRLMARVLRALAEMRRVTLIDIVTDVLSVGFDVIMSTIPTEYVVQETVAFDRARRLINGMRDVLASTATAELEPRPFFSRLKREGAEHADNCRFGHTFKGSFGFTLESPIMAPTQGELEGLSLPFLSKGGSSPGLREVYRQFMRRQLRRNPKSL